MGGPGVYPPVQWIGIARAQPMRIKVLYDPGDGLRYPQPPRSKLLLGWPPHLRPRGMPDIGVPDCHIGVLDCHIGVPDCQIMVK